MKQALKHSLLAVLLSRPVTFRPCVTGRSSQPAADVVQTWQKAGAVPGWMGIGDGLLLEFRRGDERKKGDLAALSFPVWKAGVVPLLPPPLRPFGLDLSNTEVADAGLKDLAGLTSLQSLSLYTALVVRG